MSEASPIRQLFAQYVRHYRELRGKSRKDLSEAIARHRAIMSRVEKASAEQVGQNITLDTIGAIAEYLDVAPALLFGASDGPKLRQQAMTLPPSSPSPSPETPSPLDQQVSRQGQGFGDIFFALLHASFMVNFVTFLGICMPL